MATSFFYVLVCFLVLAVTQLSFEVDSRRLVHPIPKRQHLQFLANLEGLSKGQRAKGVPELRHYLKRFGYLNKEYSPNNSEEYDEVLERAVKLYQTFFKLNVTGKLDSGTVEVMEKLRCGVPDNPVEALSRQRKKREAIDGKQQHKYLINIGADYAFFPGSPKWGYNYLNYRIENGVEPLPGFTVEELKTALAWAATVWTDVSIFTIEEAPVGHPPDMKTGFQRGDHGDGNPFTDLIFGHAFPPTDGRMHFNVDHPWSIKDTLSADQIDLVWTAIHELGHVLGLAHSQDREAIMWPYQDPGKTKRELADDDYNAITTLYPFP